MLKERKTTDNYSQSVLKSVYFQKIGDRLDCCINQAGVKATYELTPCCFTPRAKTVLMDLDGTSVMSEEFWIYLMELTVKTLTGNQRFSFTEEDIPFVSGFSTFEHLQYCIDKYNIPKSANEANRVYHGIAEYELKEILEGRGNVSAFKPRENLKEFLLELKASGVKIGLVTSGLDYKAIPEIVSAFRQLGLGDPIEFYDAIITGGKRKLPGQYGTLGEMAAKPHPWVYAEIGASLCEEKNRVIALEDSAAGLIASRLAGYSVLGFKDGNIIKSGLDSFCYDTVSDFEQVLKIIL